MIRFSVMYPASTGTSFDWDYYLANHCEMCRTLLIPRGLVRLEIDRGVGSFPPGAPAPYHAVAHLFFHDIAGMQAAFKDTVEQLIADQSNYFNAPAVVQISEVVD